MAALISSLVCIIQKMIQYYCKQQYPYHQLIYLTSNALMRSLRNDFQIGLLFHQSQHPLFLQLNLVLNMLLMVDLLLYLQRVHVQ